MPDGSEPTAAEMNPWTVFSQVITPMDSVKPLERRKGWSPEQVAAYNRDRFGDLIAAGWDLVIVDESHRMGGSTDSVARYKLGKGLATGAPSLLLLSATPHQGKTDAFFRLISLLDHKMFPTPDSITRDAVAPYVIRTIKRDAIDSNKKPLFKPRTTTLHPVRWEERHHRQQALYDAVTGYIREGYNEAISENKQYIGFLMVLMQRLVVSSTAAIVRTLERRLEVLTESGPAPNTQTAPTDEDFYDMDGQELLETVTETRERSLAHEKEHVQDLLALARECRETGPDARAEALLDLILRLRREEQDPDLKVLIFTEFIPTQEMLSTFLTGRGYSVATLNGTMAADERTRAQRQFQEEAQFLISTDAGGEGLNLQFCHVVINYDIPWNPMRLEQRIGRVDRIGQEHPVRAINFVFEDTVEFRVREVLEEKLAIIYEEFGIDKTGDVLDSAIAGEIFETLFIDSIIHPETIPASVDEAVDKIQEELEEREHHSVIMQIQDRPDTTVAETLQRHPLPSWLEQMTIAYLLAHGGKVVQHIGSYHITWPDGTEYADAVFSDTGTTPDTGAVSLTPDESHIKQIISDIPEWPPGAHIPEIQIPDLPGDVSGYWGLFAVGFSYDKPSEKSETLRHIPNEKHRYVPVFLSDNGSSYRQTARFIHDSLLTRYYTPTRITPQSDRKTAYDTLLKEAGHVGEDIFRNLQEHHQTAIRTEELRAERSFAARRKAIDQIGLGEVRSYRLRALTREINKWKNDIAAAQAVIPSLRPILLLRILPNED
jgi:superfamily II DNA or RNA helicase